MAYDLGHHPRIVFPNSSSACAEEEDAPSLQDGDHNLRITSSDGGSRFRYNDVTILSQTLLGDFSPSLGQHTLRCNVSDFVHYSTWNLNAITQSTQTRWRSQGNRATLDPYLPNYRKNSVLYINLRM